MKVDESGAPWPYPIATFDEPLRDGMPTWTCPGGTCVCHPGSGELETAEHRVVLFDHRGVRMPGARCRVLADGLLLTDAAPYADTTATIRVTPAVGTQTLRIEWAPADLPLNGPFPYHRQYFLDLGASGAQAARRRLHNLGFSAHLTLKGNVAHFQRTYGLKETGRHEDVGDTLVAFHDLGLLPPPTPVAHAAPAPKALFVADAEAREGQGVPLPTTGTPAPGGTQPRGSVTSLATTQLRIELYMAFSLHLDDFEKVDTDPKGNPVVFVDGPAYDIQALLDQMYPHTDPNRGGPGSRVWRLSAKDQLPIGGATLFSEDLLPEKTQTKTTQPNGAEVLEFDLFDDGRLAVIDITPPKGQLNSTGSPAGPNLTTKDEKARFLFRPFAISLRFDEHGKLRPDTVEIHHQNGPRHAKLIEAKPATATQPNVVRLDWRPDWMRAHSSKSEAVRFVGNSHVPLNPFDDAVPHADRGQQSPPTVVIHETATHNLSFIHGFIGALKSAANPKGVDTSIHYLVDYDGFVIKTIDEHFRSNHADVNSVWSRRVAANHFSVGVETMHTDGTPPATAKVVTPRRFTKEQYDAWIRLLKELRVAYPLRRQHVVGHLDIKLSGKKGGGPASVTSPTTTSAGTVLNGALLGKPSCPGPMFDWRRLGDAGVALKRLPLPATAPPGFGHPFPNIAELRALPTLSPPRSNVPRPAIKVVKQLLFDIGYSVSKTVVARDQLTEVYDDVAALAVTAFQRHHFAGRLRPYRLAGSGSLDAAKPPEGTLDTQTIDAIAEVWFDAMTSTD